ncbi:MAG: molybdopterin molybdenumtransferase MoeA [Burkholderiales bacterium RIFCSPHIGHO2_12_FULL_65_48]|nr:MAG: molybdopterin molybdenumtransferase MoeA [Burkholderiales bacterium RIFCSPHIGHO2_02_FULL_64_19]OGB18453.1 MAG: molybdopterin molybdenumtransferase MoeA [Burkholderiales bacterium RIFCSPHIGHO2_12_FULL_65_48]OGB51892.1 MAG: molybdopterin molybdenumtransferase MoeA [Burkholderiales bacterium RIFCSPLOWO2_12_FULL_64_33]
MKTIAQIAAELQGYDPQALSAADVNTFLERLVEPVSATEDLPLFSALGRVLAQDVVSPISVPPHDNSAMDGYAFAGDQLVAGQPLTLRVVGTALAGKAWVGTVAAGECVKIMTGAIMPTGLDTVVPQEFTTAAAADGHITIAADVLKTGDNRRFKGEDLMEGSVALAKGTLLAPAALGLVASLGLPTVTVYRRLRVAYFSTGDEILSLGEPPREGAVYDSNRYTVFGLLTRLGVEVIDLGVVRDEPELLEAAFRNAAQRADAIITSGGVSVGEADHTRTMMKKLGDVAFWRIAMRPGRPMAVGRIATTKNQAKLASSAYPSSANSYQNDTNHPHSGAVLFGLPGNPVAVMVTFLAFVRPALLRMMGSNHSTPPLLRATSTEAMRKKPGRTEYQRGTITTAADGTLQVRTTGNQGSGVLSSMVQANGLIVLHHGQGNVAVGDTVDVMVFDGVI